MRLAFVGLGKMGSQIVTKFIKGGHEVAVLDPVPEAVQAMVAIGATAATDRQDVIRGLQQEQYLVVWLMIPATAVQAELEAWLELLPPQAIVIDGGNSNFKETIKRAALSLQKQVNLIDVGTSGGVLGLQNGFSMMVGGETEAVSVIQPLLDILAHPNGAWSHFGPSGSGHYIKMVHNGIEYGQMQAYAEGYHLLHDGVIPGINLSEVSKVWQHGSIISSQLNGLVEKIYQNNPELEGIDGYVADSGEGRWTLETAKLAGLRMPALAAALLVRAASQNGQTDHSTKLLAAMRNSFGGHAINNPDHTPDQKVANDRS